MGATAQIDTKSTSPVALKMQDGKAASAVSFTRPAGDLALASSTTTVK
jgi:hypothetical protein